MDTRKLEFSNLDARPKVTVLFIREDGIADVMRWYGAFFDGDRYSVRIDGVKVKKDMDGNLIGSIPLSEVAA